MKTLLLFPLLTTGTIHAQNQGLWEGYDGEWSHVSRQSLALAEATPAEKFSWRPAPGCDRLAKSTCTSPSPISIYDVTGAKEPAVTGGLEKTVTTKADVVDWLKRSLDAVARLAPS